MRIAALYDIHANLPAVEAVVHSMEDVDLVVVGGDVVWGPWPCETMDLLLGLPNVEFIIGNADRAVLERSDDRWKATNDWCADRLTAAHVEFLRSRPATFTADGILFCHGSPLRDTDNITLGTSDERIAAWCAGVDESVIVCGHTHGQFERRVGRWHIVNAGSVGNPFGDRGAYWAMFDSTVHLKFTPYDVQRTAQRMLASGFPYAEHMAPQITLRKTAEDAARHFESSESSGAGGAV